MNNESANTVPDSIPVAFAAARKREPSVSVIDNPRVGAIVGEIFACGFVATLAIVIGTVIAAVVSLFLGWIAITC